MVKKIAVVLSGCGVYDGSEIQEAVLTLLEIKKRGGEYSCFAPDKEQMHVINHITGEEMPGPRNVLIEAARIARGEIKPLAELTPSEFDGVVFPGGFGAAKNLSTWGVSGPAGEIDPQVKRVIQETVNAEIPLGLICMSPVLVAKAFEDSDTSVKITVGTDQEKSPYNIREISDGINSLGQQAKMCSACDITVDENYKVVTTPAYMMDNDITGIAEGIGKAVAKILGH
ncbi:MAG: isoprenoid biosynthesis glyoxalase ElbB [Nitrospinota bacterium]